MGRGRAKAKQTRVARELKYSSPQTDLRALQDELSGHADPERAAHSEGEEDDPYVDRYAHLADSEEEDGR
ncbi:MAG: DUF3073 family protein [Actinomycetales bacterium]|nr:DUF3073 family protein [Actinomycetales bacterium]